MTELKCCGGIFQGSTPSLYFNTNADLDADLAAVYITFVQCGVIIFEKDINSIEKITDDEQNKIKVTLTQEETLMLSSKYDVEVQLRIKYNNDNGAAVVSEIEQFQIKEVLKYEVI